MNTSTTTANTSKAINNPGFLKKNATQLVVPLSIIVSITGLMMFFHIAQDSIEGAHEWLGIAFMVAIGLHMARNFKPMLNVIKTNRAKAFIAIAIIVLGAFVFTPKSKGENPFKQTTTLLMSAKISDAAPVFGLSNEEMTKRLSAVAGTAVTGQDSIQSIATKSKHNPVELLGAVVKK